MLDLSEFGKIVNHGQKKKSKADIAGGTNPEALTLLTLKPIPPECLLIVAHWPIVEYIPSIESSFTGSRKQDASCEFGVPALNKQGVAWMKNR